MAHNNGLFEHVVSFATNQNSIWINSTIHPKSHSSLTDISAFVCPMKFRVVALVVREAKENRKKKLLTLQIFDPISKSGFYFINVFYIFCFVSDQTERHKTSSVKFFFLLMKQESHPNSVKWLWIKAFQTLFHHWWVGTDKKRVLCGWRTSTRLKSIKRKR